MSYDPNRGGVSRPTHETETKPSFKTTELLFYVLVFLGVLIAAAVIGTDDQGRDAFDAERAWFLITLLTIGYLISRGLAKSGSRDPYRESGGSGGGIGQRVEAAVDAFKQEPGHNEQPTHQMGAGQSGPPR